MNADLNFDSGISGILDKLVNLLQWARKNVKSQRTRGV